MKKMMTSAAAAVLTAAIAVPAFAADLPNKKAPPVEPPPPSWTGFYLGVNAGYSWTSSNTINQTYVDTLPGGFATQAVLGNIPSQVYVGNGGFIGGGQVGFNWQFDNRFVLGLEADIDGLTGGAKTAYVYGVKSATTFSRSLAELGAVRARLGFAASPTLLLYATGGLAYGQGNVNGTYFGFWASTPNATDFGSQTLYGYAVGGGVEWAFLPSWSVKAEYLYYDLGSLQTPGTYLLYKSAGIGAFTTAQSSSRFDGNVVRLGLNYRLKWGGPPALFAKQ